MGKVETRQRTIAERIVATEIVDVITADLTDRAHMQSAWDEIENDVKADIRESLIDQTAAILNEADTEHRQHEQSQDSSGVDDEGPNTEIAIGWRKLQRSWRKVALQGGILALAFVAGIAAGRWGHGGPSDRFERVNPGNPTIMLDRKTGQVCWTAQGRGYQYPTCLDLYKRY